MNAIDLRHMRHALALAEHRNFGRAADRIGISQPTLSRSIQALETQVGAALFDRLPREVVPTEVGRVFLARVGPIVVHADELERELAAMLGREGGGLRVAVHPYVAAVLLGTVLGRFVRRHPSIRIEVVEASGEQMLTLMDSSSAEILVGEQALFHGKERFIVEPLQRRSGEYVCRVGHPILERGAVTLQDVLLYPIATTDTSPEMWVRVLGSDLAEFDPVALSDSAWTVHCSNLAAIAELCATSDAIGILTPGMIRRELEAGSLAVIPFEGTRPSADWGIVSRRGRTLSPAAEAFVEVVREVDAEMPEDGIGPVTHPVG